MTAAKVRPVVARLGRRGTADANWRVSTCKNCRLGIFKDQPYRWQTGRMVGLVHDFEGDNPCSP